MDLIADESRLTGAAGESPGRTGNDAMYRRWRSRNFGELIGQGHITRQPEKRSPSGSTGACLSVLRPARHRQDVHRPHPGQGCQLP